MTVVTLIKQDVTPVRRCYAADLGFVVDQDVTKVLSRVKITRFVNSDPRCFSSHPYFFQDAVLALAEPGCTDEDFGTLRQEVIDGANSTTDRRKVAIEIAGLNNSVHLRLKAGRISSRT
jgi:hypothetical protein